MVDKNISVILKFKRCTQEVVLLCALERLANCIISPVKQLIVAPTHPPAKQHKLLSPKKTRIINFLVYDSFLLKVNPREVILFN